MFRVAQGRITDFWLNGDEPAILAQQGGGVLMKGEAMHRIPAALVLSTLLVSACTRSTDGVSEARSSVGGGSPTQTMEPVQAATPSAAPACEELPYGTEAYTGRSTSRVLADTGGKVSAQANIYGAGRDAPPAPGGGGGGELPPVYLLPAGTSRVITFPKIRGQVNPIVMNPFFNGPDGDHIGGTDVMSLDGISGIVHRTNGMFLVGVFLPDAPASNPAPDILDFSDDTEFAGFDLLAPELGQVFLIGNGEGRSYTVPDDATRLFLGFADGYLYGGCPGWYGNNAGEVTVTIEVGTA